MPSKINQVPPIDLLRRLLEYNPESGAFVWRTRTPDMFPDDGRARKRSIEWICQHWNDQYAGKHAFRQRGVHANFGVIFGRKYYAHRIAWAIHHGEDDPTRSIDHINGDPRDNRIANLRLVDHLTNMRNRPMQANNSSGYVGVYFDKQIHKWKAHITVAGQFRSLGAFPNKDAAIAARREEAERLGFHSNHGRRTAA